MRKKTLINNIVVYRDILNDPKKILDCLLQSKDREKENYLPEWESWAYNGSRTRTTFSENYNDLKKINGRARDQYNAIIEIKKIYQLIISDYLNNIEDKGLWPHIKDFRFNAFKNKYQIYCEPDISILHHGITPESKLIAMNYHTDFHQYDRDSAGSKLLITITFYLNDNYENGELTFLNEENNSLIYYKPKAGDVVVFPSDYPFFHGVDKITKGDKFLIRAFASYYYEGTKKWQDERKKYSKEIWEKMEKERIEKNWNNDEYFRSVLFSDDEKNLECHGKKIIFPISRLEAKKIFTIEWKD